MAEDTTIVREEDRRCLRELARRVGEIAALPIQAERARLWKDFNALRPQRPMVLAFPEGGWRELIDDSQLQCEDPLLRGWELGLRRTVFHGEHIHDDHPITDFFNVGWVVRIGDYGLSETIFRSDPLGAYRWDAPIKEPADLKKLHPRAIELDRDATNRNVELAQSILGDVLRVRPHRHIGWPAVLSWTLVQLRGLNQVMMDVYDNPQLLHELMCFLRDDKIRELELLEREGVLSLNNGPDDYVGSGGIGCTDELPAEDFAGRPRMKDMWGFGESQEFVHVGPEHWYEFVLQYQLPILKRFAINHYGCCEPLHKKFDLLVRHVPRLRRVSVSAWWDPADAAAKLTDRYIFSWKPNPAMICAPAVNWDAVEKATRETLEIARGCCVEMIMKDTHTFAGDPTRIEHWSQIASRCAAEAL